MNSSGAMKVAGVLVASVHPAFGVFWNELTLSTVWIYFTPNWAHNLPGYGSSAGAPKFVD